VLGAFSCDTTTNATAQIECLRAVPWYTLVTNPNTVSSVKYFSIDWSPVIDGVYVPTDYYQRFANGTVTNKVPTVVWFDLNEGTIFNTLPFNSNQAEVSAAVLSLFGPALTPTILKLYNYSDFATPWWMLSQVIGDFFEVCPSRRAANAFSQAGIPTWVVEYSHMLKGDESLGVFHGSELPFIFKLSDGDYGGVFNLSLSSAELKFGRELRQYLIRLGKNGSPNPSFLSTSSPFSVPKSDFHFSHFWPPYDSITEPYLIANLTFSDALQISTVRCLFWNVAYPK